MPATLGPRMREIVCCLYLDSRAEPRLIKMLLAILCGCRELLKGAAVAGGAAPQLLLMLVVWGARHCCGRALCYAMLAAGAVNFCILHTLAVCSLAKHVLVPMNTQGFYSFVLGSS